LLAALLIGFGTTAHAQEKYPTRPIRLLVPFPAGGPVDVMGSRSGCHRPSVSR
jgi:tripartite-type tricarboxylate transporter receptor subunit TctC